MRLFNPWHDLALANFAANYTPPDSAVKMAEDLALLPVWYGEGDAVIAEGDINRSFVDDIKETLPVASKLISFEEIALHPHEKIMPWGWDPALCRKLLTLGAVEEQIPTMMELSRLREYANRQNAVRLLCELKNGETASCSESHNFDLKTGEATFYGDSHNFDLKTFETAFCGESHYFTRIEELLAFLQSVPGDKVLKMPLSGSGKGLVWILGDMTDKQTGWCRRVIRQQGGVVAEPVLHKVLDFAMEFYLDGGACRFAAYSLFHAAASGAYRGNALLSDSRIEEKLSAYVPAALLHRLREALSEKLVACFPLYTGYAGVDMMVCETDEGYRVQPCVEINLRMNMGMVARIFHDRYMQPGTEGQFVVDYFKKPSDALSFHQKMQRDSPLRVENGKIVSGYLSLTPVTADTRYMAYVVCF